MKLLTVHNLPDDVHRALHAQALLHGRSPEAEACDILMRALNALPRLRMGDALAALGREVGLTDDDLASIERLRDTGPAQPMSLA